jgi:D-alanyl-D-alanine carboxypeptidase
MRAPAVGFLLSLLAFLSPDLTLAPLSAGEPLATSVRPIDQLEPAVLPLRVRHMDDGRLVPVRTAPVRTAPVAQPPTADDPRFVAAVEAARARGEAFGVTFAAVRDGELLWSGASGRYRDGVTQLHGDDPLVIGSVTKTFVAATILQLVDEGRLSLADTVSRHLPDEKAVTPDITIRQLLDHTSGLADVFNDTTKAGLELEPQRAWTAAEIMTTLHAPWYRPGEGYAYANTNYYLLGLVIERVTGSSLADELDRRFFTPLGLASTGMLTADGPPGGPLEPAWATIFWASGAMSSSAADLARWGDELYGGTILSDGSRAEMLELNRDDYGLGVKRLEVPGAVGYGHTGMLKTFTSLLLYLPEQDVTLTILVNRTHVDLAGMLAAAPPNGPSLLELVGVPKPAPAPVSAPAAAAP